MRTVFLNPSMQVRVKKSSIHDIQVNLWGFEKKNRGFLDGFKKPTGKPHGFFSSLGISSLNLMILKKNFFGKLLSCYLQHISVKRNLIPHCERLAQVGKNVHSQLVRLIVSFISCVNYWIEPQKHIYSKMLPESKSNNVIGNNFASITT